MNCSHLHTCKTAWKGRIGCDESCPSFSPCIEESRDDKEISDEEIERYKIFNRNNCISHLKENVLHLYDVPKSIPPGNVLYNTNALNVFMHTFQKAPMLTDVNGFTRETLRKNDARELFTESDLYGDIACENVELAQKINLLIRYVRKAKYSKNRYIVNLYKEKIVKEFGFDVDVKEKVNPNEQ
jgi:hypothetical protein